MRPTILILAVIVWMLAAIWAWLAPADPNLRVLDARAFPLAGAPRAAMVTLTVDNPGGADRLLDVATDAAKLAILKAPDVSGLPMPEKSKSSLVAEAGHIMLTGLLSAPNEGDVVPLKLRFERAGDIQVDARVSFKPDRDRGAESTLADPLLSLSITAMPDEDGWMVRIATSNFQFAPDLMGKAHRPNTGHAVLYVQGVKLGPVFGPEARVAALPAGQHHIRVTLQTNDQRTYMANGREISAEAIVKSQ